MWRVVAILQLLSLVWNGCVNFLLRHRHHRWKSKTLQGHKVTLGPLLPQRAASTDTLHLGEAFDTPFL